MSNKIFSLIFIVGFVQADKHDQLPVVDNIIKKGVCRVKGRQETSVSRDTDLSTCSTQELVQFMMWASDDQVRSSFAQMPLQAKHVFLKEMNIQQYGFFLHAFSDNQWQCMWRKLPKAEQQTIPPTKLEQLKMIRDVWCACSSGDTARYARAKGDASAQDLPVWRDKALSSIRYLDIHHPHPHSVGIDEKERIFYKWLNNSFQAKKLELLKEFIAARE